MDDRTRANNTIYFKVMNEDVRVGGIYHNLDNSEFRTMIILQGYASTNGKVYGAKGKAYTNAELVVLFGMNWRTVKRTLQSLEDKGLITTNDNSINITNFVYMQTASDTELRKRRDRDYNNGLRTGLKQKQKTTTDVLMHQALATANKTNILLSEQNKLLSGINDGRIVNTDTGEILED